MRKNIVQRRHTHEGGRASHINPLQALRRSVMACLLWEKEFYEDGETIAERIQRLTHQCAPEDVALVATEARLDFRLRHAPLMLARELARHPKAKGKIVGDAICNVIQRADELAEFLALYWADGKQPLSKQVKAGLACAFRKFEAYHLAKYNRKGAVSLRDVLFMVHAKPKDKEQGEVWRQLVDGALPAPDTWEVALSGGGDKKEVFTRLMREKKLGYMALLRNLRNMHEAGVDADLVKGQLLEGAAKSKALPFRFIAAARACPAFEPTLDEAMQLALSRMDRLPGKTIVLVDVSYSMVGTKVSSKSDIDRLDAAAALAALVRGVSDNCEVFTFSHVVEQKPARRGMALIDAIRNTDHSGTYLGQAVQTVNEMGYDRLIVFTDEQSADRVPAPKGVGYMINVASYQNGVGYGAWTHIDGFSEAVVRFIQEIESVDSAE